MTKSANRHRKGHRDSGGARPTRRDSDSPVYISFVIVGLAIVGAAWLLTEGKQAGTITLGYLIAVAWLVNLYAISAYLGRRLARWQAALARLPLRCAGYGKRHGKPLEACRGAEDAKMMIFVSIAFSVAVLVGLSFLLLPELR